MHITIQGHEPQSTCKQRFLEYIPSSPGVYILSEGEDILYVGKSKDLHQRLSQYKSASRRKKHRKMRTLFKVTTHISLHLCKDETEALLLENRFIQELEPPMNVAGAYYFLYPFIGVCRHPENPKQLNIIYSTDESALHEDNWQYYGCYRSRLDSKNAFHSLSFLLGLLGHEDSRAARQLVPAEFTIVRCFRQIDSQLDQDLQDFLSGKTKHLLLRLAEALLEKPGARDKAKEVQLNLRSLARFYHNECQRLRQALQASDSTSATISQEDRDALFIRVQA